MKFPKKWINLIFQCISTVEYQILLNGNRTSPIFPSRGIRQGDPLSPYLYILSANILSCLIIEQEKLKKWKGIRICQNATPVSHLLYADDSVFFFEITRCNVSCVQNVLRINCTLSGQDINYEKSTLVVSPNTMTDWSTVFGISISDSLGKYLGTYVDNVKDKYVIYKSLLDAIDKRLASWKISMLSQASRLQLIKSVLSASNLYQLSYVKIPKHILYQVGFKV